MSFQLPPRAAVESFVKKLYSRKDLSEEDRLAGELLLKMDHKKLRQVVIAAFEKVPESERQAVFYCSPALHCQGKLDSARIAVKLRLDKRLSTVALEKEIDRRKRRGLQALYRELRKHTASPLSQAITCLGLRREITAVLYDAKLFSLGDLSRMTEDGLRCIGLLEEERDEIRRKLANFALTLAST